jgi:hypothetical protein
MLASGEALPPLVRLQRALLLTSLTALAAACGEKFNAALPGVSAGSGGKPAGGAEQGGTAGSATAGRGAEAGEGGDPVPAPEIPLAGLQIWLRADEGVTQASRSVSVWQDTSGNQRDALQTAFNYSPKLIDDALAGKAALVFDGEDDFLKLDALGVDFSGGVSIFFMLQQETTSLCDAYFEASTAAEENDLHFGDWEDNYNYEVLEDVVHDTHYQALLHEPQIATVVQGADGWARLRSNGNGVGERQITLPMPVLRTQVFIGKTLYRDCGAFHGAIGELIVYNRGVKDSELLQIEQYLRSKWQCCGQ